MRTPFEGSDADRIDQPTAGRLAGHYDLTVAHPGASPERHAAFDAWLVEACGKYGLSCARLTSAVASTAAERLSCNDQTIGLHVTGGLDWRRDEGLVRLAFAAHDAGAHALNVPARARAFTDRGAACHELVSRGLGVPPTVIVRPWAGIRPLSDHERWHLRLDEPGACAEILPAGRGEVVRVEHPSADRLREALQRAREDRPGETFLIRPEIRPPWLTCEDGECRPAYWRVVSCLGETTAFWWQPAGSRRPAEPAYREVTAGEVRAHSLQPIFRHAQVLAELSGLEWFRTDLTLCPYPRPGALTVPDVDGLDLPLVAADPLDDRVELAVQSRGADGVPDAVVRRTAWRLAELAWQVRRAAVPGVVRLRAG